jgi:YVTN family beta-propeller protein
VFSPDVKWLYVALEDSDVVDVIDARTQKQVAR